MKRSIIFCLVTIYLFSAMSLLAGSYSRVADCSEIGGCAAALRFSDLEPVPPFAIAHVPGFDGTPGASFQFRICIAIGSESLSGPTQRAIDTWNTLAPMTGNCENCDVWEDAPSPPTRLHAESAILHELGHCPLALDHPDRNWDGDADGVFESTSFTRSWRAGIPTQGVPGSGGIQAGPDFIRGSPDDTQVSSKLGQLAESVSWFRKADNNPFIVDATVVDSITYSRSTAAMLPVGDTWAANANRRVGEVAFGVNDTQAVMYSLQVEGQQYRGLSADDVNMLKMARTGEDRLAGTADDYTVELVLSCEDPIHVLVGFGPVALPGSAAECKTALTDLSFPQGVVAFHHTLRPDPADGLFFITLNDQITWETDSPIFSNGVESGNTSSWSVTQP